MCLRNFALVHNNLTLNKTYSQICFTVYIQTACNTELIQVYNPYLNIFHNFKKVKEELSLSFL